LEAKIEPESKRTSKSPRPTASVGLDNDAPQSPPPIATFQFERSVRFADTDATGFAHFSTYVRMMEETEYAFLRSRDLCVVLYDERGTMGFPRLSAEINVINPLVFEQTVTVQLKLVSIDGKQIRYEFDLFDEFQESYVTGVFDVACCRFPDNQPPFAVLIPDQVEEALREPDD
jgi:YbgC/YbaW family acyl-CoA thioester hydrolase